MDAIAQSIQTLDGTAGGLLTVAPTEEVRSEIIELEVVFGIWVTELSLAD